MKQRSLLGLILTLSLLAACAKQATAPNGPALGDSPTLTGTISNLDEAEVEGTDLIVKIENANGSVLAEGNVTIAGIFTIQLPGRQELEGELVEEDPQDNCSSGALTAEPKMYKSFGLKLVLYSNGQRVEDRLYYADGSLVGGQSETRYMFIDRDARVQGTCDTGVGIYSFELDMKEGWNSAILGLFPDGQSYGLRTAVPDSSFEWVIPVCQIGCPN